MQSYEFQNHGWWPIRVYTSHFCGGNLRNLCLLVLKPERNRFAAGWVCAILETFPWSISMLNSGPLPGRMFPKLPIISKSDSSDLPAGWMCTAISGFTRSWLVVSIGSSPLSSTRLRGACCFAQSEWCSERVKKGCQSDSTAWKGARRIPVARTSNHPIVGVRPARPGATPHLGWTGSQSWFLSLSMFGQPAVVGSSKPNGHLRMAGFFPNVLIVVGVGIGPTAWG